MVIILAIYIVSVAIDFYIFRDLITWRRRKATQLTPWKEAPFLGPYLYVYLSLALLAALTVVVCLPRRGDSSLLPIVWSLYIYITLYGAKLFYVVGSAIGRIPQIFRKKRLDTGIYIGLPLALLAVFTMIWGATVGRRHIETTEVDIVSAKVPKSFDGYRMVQISDLHVDCWGSDTSFVAKVVEKVNSLQPDIIFFTGDIVSRSTPEIQPFIGPLSRLSAPDGVFSVMGNHDYGDYHNWPSEKAHKQNTLDLIAIQEQKLGWRMLNNDYVLLSRGTDTIALIGVENWGEPPFKQYGNLAKAYPCDSAGRISDSRFKILLSHNPMHWHEEVRNATDIDLTLSGHTHAMQTMFSLGDWRWSPSQWRYPEWAGLYRSATPYGTESMLYVNIGLGEVAMPSRIGTSFPEITLLTLKTEKR